MYNQAKLLSNNNYKVGIISSGLHSVNHFFKKKEYERFEKDNDLIIYRNYIQHFFINRYTPFEYLKGVHWKLCNQLFKKYIKNHGMPDIIHSHNILYSGFCANIISKKYKIPYIITEHSSDYHKHYSLNFLKKIPKLINNTNGLFTVSKINSNALKSKLGISKVDVIPNIVSKEFELFQKEKPIKKEGIYNFIMVANLLKIKNIFLALRAFKVLKESGQNKFSLNIIGDGPNKNSIKKYIKKHNLSNNISLMGRLSQAEVKKQYYNSDCLIVTSRYETFCNVIIEAMMCGLKVISTNVGIANEVINKENGVIIKNNSISLINAINKVIKLQNDDNRIFIHNEILKRFSQKKFLLTISKLYKQNNAVNLTNIIK